MADGPHFTAAEIWRVAFSVDGELALDLLEPLEELALSVSVFEETSDGGFETLSWRVELLFDGRPDPAELASNLGPLLAPHGVGLDALAVEQVPDEDWLAATARQAVPIVAGPFFVHGSHARDQRPSGMIAIEIDAGLAFGSGEHGTTRGCLEALARIARRPARVLDMGCGSGVLAIAAAKRWPAAAVLAVDNDPVAVRVATENVRLNRVAQRVALAVSDGYASSIVRRAGPFDLVLANILADPLMGMAPALARRLAPGGRAILSGLLDRQAEAVLEAHRQVGLQLAGRIDHGPWTTLVLRPRSTSRVHEGPRLSVEHRLS